MMSVEGMLWTKNVTTFLCRVFVNNVILFIGYMCFAIFFKLKKKTFRSDKI